MLQQQVAELQADEGLRLTVYDDATGQSLRPGMRLVGHPTLGVGRALDVNGITRDEALALLAHDLARTEIALSDAYGWFGALDPVRQGVCINLAFNVGLGGFARFRRMHVAIARADWITAAHELATSRWAQQVQRSRSSRLIVQMQTGQLDGDQSMALIPNNVVAGSLELNVNVRLDPASQGLLSSLMASITNFSTELETMSGTLGAAIDRAVQAAQRAETVEQSATAAFQVLSQQLRDALAQAQSAGATAEQLQALNDIASGLDQNTQPLADAIATQPPAGGGGGQPAPAPEPAPEPAPAPAPEPPAGP